MEKFSAEQIDMIMAQLIATRDRAMNEAKCLDFAVKICSAVSARSRASEQAEQPQKEEHVDG